MARPPSAACGSSANPGRRACRPTCARTHRRRCSRPGWARTSPCSQRIRRGFFRASPPASRRGATRPSARPRRDPHPGSRSISAGANSKSFSAFRPETASHPVTGSSSTRAVRLCHLFLRNLAARLLRPREPEERVRVLLVLEELPGWGALPGLAEHLATYRSRRVSVLATLQSDAQGEYVYGRDGWAAISANLVTKLYLPSLADVDAERLSRAMGTAAGEDIASSRGWGAAGARKGEQRRAIPVLLQRPEELRGIGRSPDESHQSEGPGEALPAAAAPRLPGNRPVPGGRAGNPRPGLPRPPGLLLACQTNAHPRCRRKQQAPRPDPPVAGEAAHGAEPAQPAPRTPLNDHAPGDDATADDIAQLNRLVEALLLSAGPDRPAAIRAVRGGGRIVEIRADPRDIVRACGRPDVMHGLARRWSALRWVRRVRPSFVLSRRALDVLEPRLARRLMDLCARDVSET